MNPKPRILLLDDSEPTVDGIKSFLEERYEVITATNGMGCLKALEENERPFDLVITDLMMPLMDGMEVVSVLRQKSPKTPIIVMTGWEQHAKGMLTEAKAEIVLVKPFDLEDLDQSVSKLLAEKR